MSGGTTRVYYQQLDSSCVSYRLRFCSDFTCLHKNGYLYRWGGRSCPTGMSGGTTRVYCQQLDSSCVSYHLRFIGYGTCLHQNGYLHRWGARTSTAGMSRYPDLL